MATLTLDHELATDDGRTWTVSGPDDAPVAVGADDLRVSLSWKATVFTDDDDRRRHDDHLDDLTAEEVLSRFAADLAERGLDSTVPTQDPFRDPGFVTRLQDAYMRYPA
jgi:hypothetical protein